MIILMTIIIIIDTPKVPSRPHNDDKVTHSECIRYSWYELNTHFRIYGSHYLAFINYRQM